MALTIDSTTVVQPKVVTTTTTTSQPTGAQQVQEQTYNYQPTEDDKNMGLQVETTTTQKEKAVSATEAKSKHVELVSINLKIKKIDDKMKEIENILSKEEVTKYDLQELGLRKTSGKLKNQYKHELLGGLATASMGAGIAAIAGAAIPLMIFGGVIFAAGLAVSGKGLSDLVAWRKGGYDLHLSQEKYRDDLKEMYMQLAEERESLNAQLAELNKYNPTC